MAEDTSEILERGNIYFIYRPKVTEPDQDTAAEDLDDVQRSYLVLAPHGRQLYRLISSSRLAARAVR
ncbi:MAG: hypothetical protein R3310_06230 [Candidatus Competibacteraceae bacterium]|nr:hypothetical protein [Candidatus Competibacteraceae bacterium]